MLDLLPNEIWSDSSIKILDPACKSWVFLREAAKRFIKWLENEFPDLQERIDHIMTKQLFWIWITNLTALLSRRSLYCSKNAKFDPNEDLWKYSICTKFEANDWNIWFDRVEHEWKNGNCIHCGASQSEYERNSELESHAYKFIHSTPEEINVLFGLDPKMRFDVIIWNPPYQLSDWSWWVIGWAMPLYHKFVEQAKKLQPKYLSMIIPSRWFAWWKWLNEFRETMLNDKRISKIVDFPKSRECFPWVDIAWWVCYFLRNRDKSWECLLETNIWLTKNSRIRQLDEFSIFIRDNIWIDIIHKIQKQTKDFFISEVLSVTPFGFSTNERWHQKKEKDDIYLISSAWVWYVKRNEVKKNVDKIVDYKISIWCLNPDRWWVNNASDWKSNVITKPKILKPEEIVTWTYLIISTNNNLNNIENRLSYIKTKFFRYLVFLTLSSMHITMDSFQFVPMQDFSKSRTDEELYKKYNLSQEEIDYIETMIKPMD